VPRCVFNRLRRLIGCSTVQASSQAEELADLPENGAGVVVEVISS